MKPRKPIPSSGGSDPGRQELRAPATAERTRLELTAVFNALADAVFVYDEGGLVVEANPAARETFGVTPGESRADLNRRLEVRRLDGTPLPLEEMPSVQALRTQTVVRERLLVKNVHGEELIVLASGSPLLLEESPAGTVAVWHDVTQRELLLQQARRERKRAENLTAGLQQLNQLNDALNNINLVINSTLDTEVILRQAAAEAAKATESEASVILLRQADNWLVRVVHGRRQEEIGFTLNEQEAPIATLAARTGRPVVISDTLRDPRVNPSLATHLGVRSMLGAPIQAKDEVIGTLNLFRAAPGGYLEVEVDFASKLAASLALALENARLYETERTTAQTLQEALLSLPRHVPRLAFGHLYRSATEATLVGGDFYDVFVLDKRRVGVVMGDVSGKGVKAATVAAVIKDTIKAYAYQEKSPATIMKLTNAALIRSISFSSFATVFLGILDLRTGRLVYSSAGHPPALLRRQSGETAFMEVFSTVLGAFVDAEFRPGRETLAEGDLLVLYTDGVTEAREGRELFGEDRLLSLVRRQECRDVKRLPGQIFAAVEAFSGGNLKDDLAILALCRRARASN